MPLNLREAASNLIDAGYSDDEIKTVISGLKSEASKLMDSGLPDDQIQSRLSNTRFKGKDGKDINLFSSSAPAPSAEPASMTKTAEPSAIGQAVQAVTDNPIVQGAATMVKKSALPMAGQSAGLWAGTALGGPVGGVVGEAIGGGLGEAANQLVGINEPSLSEIALSTLSGPLARGAMGALRIGAGSLLKGFGGRQNITDIATAIAGKIFGPKIPSEELFQRASQITGFIPTYKASNAVSNILKAEGNNPSATSQTIKDAVSRWRTTFQQVGPTVNAHQAQDLATYAQDLRLEATAAYAAKNHRLGNALNDLRAAIFDDAASFGVPEFAAAAKAYRREVTVDKLGGIIRQANPVKAFDDLMGSRAPKDKLFKTDFSDEEAKQVKALLQKLTTIAPSGFSGVLGRSIAAGAASTLSNDPFVKGSAAVAGWLAPDIAAYALSTRAGRKFTERLLVGNVWDAPKAAALTQFVRAQRAEDAKSGDMAEAIKASLKSPRMSIQDKIKAAMSGVNVGGAGDLLPNATAIQTQ